MNVVNVTDMVSNSGSDSAVWNGSTFDDDLNGSLSAQDIDTIAAHAADKDMTVGDYLEANGFDFGGQTGYIAASHFNDYNGSKALMGYTKNEGITGAASDNVETASSRVNIIEHWHAGFGSSSSSSKLECSSSLNLIFFSRA